MLSGTDDPEQPAGYPFRGPGLRLRVAPFAAVAALAEASLTLPPGPGSGMAAVVSLVLLIAVAAEFALPWARLPRWLTVLVPLTYCGSVLALILAAGVTSGIGLVILVPLIWTALYHRRWESACILVAITAVELIISLTPVAAPALVLTRRVILWPALGTMVAFASHELRERSHRSRQQAVRLQADLAAVTVAADRERIAADLHDKVIQQLFAAGLSLQSIAMRTTQPDVRDRILATDQQLDEVIRVIRDTVFESSHRLHGQGLRAELHKLFAQLPAVPDISFTGPAGDAADPARTARLIEAIQRALPVISQHTVLTHVAVTSTAAACVVEIRITPAFPSGDAASSWAARLRDGISRAGTSVRIRPEPDGMRLILSVTLRAALSGSPAGLAARWTPQLPSCLM